MKCFLIGEIELKPDWLKIRLPSGTGIQKFASVKQTIKGFGLTTVCEEARCPNISECWSGGTATFMVLGDTCTRGCRFCHVKTSRYGQNVDVFESFKLGQAVKSFGLKYVVITSVDRDDLPDQGAMHFAACIKEVKKQNPQTLIEVLIPDFRASTKCLDTIIDAQPEVIAHNIETVKRLQAVVRDRHANYDQSLFVLDYVKKKSPDTITKSSIMVGLSETDQEVLQAMDDLRAIGVDCLTIGQYLQPSQKHLKVTEFVPPEKFELFKQKGMEKGFLYVASGPFVRSSYRAGEFFIENVVKKRKNK